jgi:glycosyltransferase involved in cell wall biosynthesis
MPKVSIIVPIFNVEQYLHKCIDSLLAQSLQDIEIILVDDGSKDSSEEICDEYDKKDKRIVVIHKINGGLSSARNAGIRIASGEYLGFVDGDDWVDTNMYEVLYELCNENNADIGTCKISRNDKSVNNVKQGNKFNIEILNKEKAIHRMYEGKLTGFSACNKLFEKKIFFNILFPEGRAYEDAAIMYRLYDYANCIVYVDEPFYHYIFRDNSITTGNFSEKRFDIVLNYQEAYSYMELNYPCLCERLNQLYFSSLYGMFTDLISENSLIDRNNYLNKVIQLMKENNNRILKSSIIPIKYKFISQLLIHFPVFGVLTYRMKKLIG